MHCIYVIFWNASSNLLKLVKFLYLVEKNDTKHLELSEPYQQRFLKSYFERANQFKFMKRKLKIFYRKKNFMDKFKICYYNLDNYT